MSNEDKMKIVEDNISVRIDPFIYAFSTNTIPNYLKIGDTNRGVELRIKEWESILKKKLHPTQVILSEKYRHSSLISSKDMFFRDYDVHRYLRETLHKDSIDVTDPELLQYYSNEFFKNVSVENVQEAINDIVKDGESDNPEKKYNFYSQETAKSKDFKWNNDADWKLRPNQQEVVNNYLNKIDKKELLMFAVMRFGKSFTSLQCALHGKKNKVLVVSAKAEVLSEWKQNVQRPKCFKDYEFICDKDLKNYNTIKDKLDSVNKEKYVMFLTLQNLSGKASDGSDIKDRLKKVFDEKYDLLIIDETHYGAWAKTYGSTISEDEDYKSIKIENEEYDKLVKSVKKIKANQRLHLSGTPYKLLYDNKFDDDNIIATYQFKDILIDKEKWNEKHFLDIENGVINPETGYPYQESDNPYFGFPKMLRFAFNLPDRWINKLKEYSKSNIKWSLSDLFKTKKVENKVKFINEEEVLGLLKAIDGSSNEDGILGFLNVPKIKDNDVCKHIVMVLPFRSSCDAMEDLLIEHKDEFINLKNYCGLINIAGKNAPNNYSKVDNIKEDIDKYEKNNQKTISLTVNRMLTGVTVKQWDTMLMLKNTKSAQEYDQATFRIQNQYVIDYVDSDGMLVKKDMKPQTILVDFDPMRLFEIQGLSSRIIDKIKNDGTTLDDSIEQELQFFPIITYNSDKLVKVEANNLIEIIMQYNKEQSIIDKANSVQLDTTLLEDEYIKNYINAQYKAGLKNKISEKAHKGSKESKFSEPDINDEDYQNSESSSTQNSDSNDNKEIIQKYRMCIACILFYSFLTNSNVSSLEDVLSSFTIQSDELERNKRLYKNLKLDKKFIKEHIKKASRINAFDIDGFIKNANILSKDSSLSVEERAINALNKFSKISDSEIVTPTKLCQYCLKTIGVDKLIEYINRGGIILDIASKTGEFAFAIFQLLKDRVEINKLKDSIYSIPTSTITYEFTRKIYEVLGLNIGCISKMTSFDVLEMTDKKINIKSFIYKNFGIVLEGDKNMKFSVVVGNPPYQATVREASTGNNKNTVDIYQDFQSLALKLSDATCMIYPAKDYQRGKLNTMDKSLISLRIYNGSNREGEKHIPGEESVFGDAVRRIPGDVGLIYYNNDKTFQNDKVLYQDIYIDRTDKILPVIKEFLPLSIKLKNYVNTFEFSKVKKVCESNFVELNKAYVKENVDRNNPSIDGYSKVLTNDKAGSGGKSKWYYIRTDKLDRSPSDNYKVVIPSARPNEGLANSSNIEILSSDENFGRSKLCIYDSPELEKAENCKKYLSTKFARAVNMMTPDNFLYYLPNFEAIYTEIDWLQSIDNIDKQLYKLFNIDENTQNYINSLF